MELPTLPSGFTLFAHQVAGHMFQEGKQGVLSSGCPDDNTILKPVQKPPKGDMEVEFYKKLYHQRDCKDKTDSELLSFVPNFFGVVTLPLGKSHEIIEHSDRHLKLEDVTKPFKLPAVLDLKMGLKVWGDDKPMSKVQRERKKFPFQEVIGFRVVGMKIYSHTSSTYMFYDRFYGRTLLSEELIYNALKMYVEGAPKNLQRDVTAQIISKLGKIYNWFECQRRYKFIASSLLLVYDASKRTKGSSNATDCAGSDESDGGNKRENEHCHCDMACDGQDTEEKDSTPDEHQCVISSVCSRCSKRACRQTSHVDLVDVRLIDFTHVYETNEYDNNFVVGLRNLISFFEKINSALQHTT